MDITLEMKCTEAHKNCDHKCNKCVLNCFRDCSRAVEFLREIDKLPKPNKGGKK